jgi:hypothetical protein
MGMGLYNVFLILHSSCLIYNGLKELLELCADARKRYRDEDAPPADGVKRASSVEQKVVRFKKSLKKYFSATAVHIWYYCYRHVGREVQWSAAWVLHEA